MKNINKQLFEAVELNEIKEVKRLIEEGANVNAVDEDAISPASTRTSSPLYAKYP